MVETLPYSTLANQDGRYHQAHDIIFCQLLCACGDIMKAIAHERLSYGRDWDSLSTNLPALAFRGLRLSNGSNLRHKILRRTNDLKKLLVELRLTSFQVQLENDV